MESHKNFGHSSRLNIIVWVISGHYRHRSDGFLEVCGLGLDIGELIEKLVTEHLED